MSGKEDTHTIRGRIIHAGTKAVVTGLRVRAFDADVLSEDDYLGEGRTDKNGNFRIQYRKTDFVKSFLESLLEGGPDLVPILNQHQPNAIVFQGPAGTRNLIRWVGNERGVAPYPCWSTAKVGTAEGGTVEKVFGGDPDGQYWIPGECDVPVRNHDWFWKPGREDRLYSVEHLVDMYYRSVGRNCNLLLNANPNPDGLIPEGDFQRYVEFGKEIKRRFGKQQAATDGTGNIIELAFDKPTSVNHVIVMEDIAAGERVRAYKVEGLLGSGQWKVLCDGVSIGHTRIAGNMSAVEPVPISGFISPYHLIGLVFCLSRVHCSRYITRIRRVDIGRAQGAIGIHDERVDLYG